MTTDWDVVVVGGGAAGLSAAVMLGRSRRSVVVIDAGDPRNAPAEHMHGFLGHDGLGPLELLTRGRAEVERYGGTIRSGEVVALRGSRDDFTVMTADGEDLHARRVVVTTGLTDELPDIPGLSDRWGRDVLHCPYCHGWEVQDQPIAVLGTGPRSVHQAQLFRQLSDEVTLLTNKIVDLTAAERDDLAERGIAVRSGAVEEVLVDDDRISGVRVDGDLVPCTAVVVGPRASARAGLLASLGLSPAEHPAGVGDHVPADPMGQTAVPGVFVAGNVNDPAAQVVTAAAAGTKVGATVNADLLGLLH
jgi:thioredoxin reductase